MGKTLEELKRYLNKMKQYEHVVTLLYWDMKTGTPKLGQEGHIEALTHFSSEAFALSTSDELGNILDALAVPDEFSKLDSLWQFIVTRMKRDFDRDRRIPADLYEAFVKAQAESGNAWEEAKNASDFSIFAPHLKKMIDMQKEITAHTDPGTDAYDALLNQYEEGMDAETIDRLFDDLKTGLIPLVKQILAAGQPDASKFRRYFDPDAQKKVQQMLLTYIGFRSDAGKTAESMHPFTLNFSSRDVRVTNHFHENDPVSAIFSAIHEGGHAIFEQNVNPDYDNTAAGSCNYMGVHESQSRFYENMLGRNRNFWIPVYDRLQELMPEFSDITLDEFTGKSTMSKTA